MLKYPNSRIFQQICRHIDRLSQQKNNLLVAIDGNCGAGKSTLATDIAAAYDCNLVSMDDFFLPPAKRSPERLNQPGGNVDYERFALEVLQPLLAGQDFGYRPYDCHSQSFGLMRVGRADQLTIVEGAYACHPYFGGVYDLRILLQIKLICKKLVCRRAILQVRFSVLLSVGYRWKMLILPPMR